MGKKMLGVTYGDWYDAQSLQNPQERNKIKEKQGCYKWWAKEKEVDLLLDRLLKNTGLKKNMVKECLEFEDGYYCVYVGEGKNVRERIKKHISGKVRTSTERKAIASLMEFFANPEKEVNEHFIDRFMVQPIYVKDGFERKNIETVLINEADYLRILNYEKNYHNLAEKTRLNLFDAKRKAEKKNPTKFKKKVSRKK